MRTVTGPAAGSFKNRGSRFLGFLQPAASPTAAEEAVKILRSQYPDARHHCYAFRIGADAHASDDGEPAHSAGSPILRRLQSHDLTHCVCVVVRYFGGVKLGIPGLIEAYGAAAEAAIQQAAEAGLLQAWVPSAVLQVRFPYDATAAVSRWQHALQAQELDAAYAADCCLQLRIPAKNLQEAQASVPPGVNLEVVHADDDDLPA